MTGRRFVPVAVRVAVLRRRMANRYAVSRSLTDPCLVALSQKLDAELVTLTLALSEPTCGPLRSPRSVAVKGFNAAYQAPLNRPFLS